MTRGLQVFLCLLLVLTGSPALAHCRPENRVWDFSQKSSNLASQEVAQPIDTPSENPGCGYDSASGMHKYLYCKGNPISGVDPSGHMESLGAQLASFSIRNVLVGIAIAIPFTQVGIELANMYGGHAPDSTQQAKLNSVLSYLNSATNWPASVQPYKTIAVGAHYRVYDDPNNTKNWAETRPYGQLFIHTIYLNERSFYLNVQFLASMLIHEAVHTTQWGVTDKNMELPAYDVQSDALRTMGISGSIHSPEIQKLFKEKNDQSWATQVSDNMEDLNVKNPALYRKAP